MPFDPLLTQPENTPIPQMPTDIVSTMRNDTAFQAITGSLRTENGTNYTWSVKAFKKWKKQFKNLFAKTHGQQLSDIIPDSSQRERLYKALLGMQGFDVFRNGHTEGAIRVEATLLRTCQSVAALLEPSRNGEGTA